MYMHNGYWVPSRVPGGFMVEVDGAEVILKPFGNYDGLHFENVIFDGLMLAKSSFNGARFTGCSMDATEFSHSDFRSARFDGCTMTNISLVFCDLTDVVFSQCAAPRSRCHATRLTRTVATDTDLAGSGFDESIIALSLIHI